MELALLKNVRKMGVARSYRCLKRMRNRYSQGLVLLKNVVSVREGERGATVAQKNMRNRISQEPALLKTW